MVSKGIRKGNLRFVFTRSGASRVLLAGDFNQWKPLPMRKQKDGSFVANLDLRPGTHEYKFIVDGQWTVDPDNSAWALNPYGTLNSVAVVE
jgi:1,4-alpha-glucan branching enzyme